MNKIAGQKLKRARLKAKLSADDITFKCKLSFDEYMALKHNLVEAIDKKILDKLCKILKCRDTDILKG